MRKNRHLKRALEEGHWLPEGYEEMTEEEQFASDGSFAFLIPIIIGVAKACTVISVGCTVANIIAPDNPIADELRAIGGVTALVGAATGLVGTAGVLASAGTAAGIANGSISTGKVAAMYYKSAGPLLGLNIMSGLHSLLR